MPDSSKRKFLRMAEQHLAESDEFSMVYAALNLRMCIETIIYAKIEAYRKYVPSIVYDHWQPAHAMKVLKQFEPDADSSFRIAIAKESSPGVRSGPLVSLGEHHALSARWLSRNYGKLGSYLHVRRGKSTERSDAYLRKGLSDIADEVRLAVSSTVGSASLALRCTFECQICGVKASAHDSYVRAHGEAYCVNHECGARHIVNCIDTGYEVRVDQIEFKCLSCEGLQYLTQSAIEVGLRYECLHCKAEHAIISQHWGYDLVSNLEGAN